MNRLVLIVACALVVSGTLLLSVLAPVDSSLPGSAQPLAPGPAAEDSGSAESLPGMVFVRGGTFTMGLDEPPHPAQNPLRIKPDEFPAHPVTLSSFWMDETPVTNAQFAEFVAMTGYVTFAEKQPTREDFARTGVDPSLIPDDKLKPGSICFNRNFDQSSLIQGVPNWEYQVWQVVDGANWRHPEGPDSDLTGRADHPVVHVNWEDAVAYCQWAGKRLPTEAEFEYAARNRGQDILYPWGNELTPDGNYRANFWQGEFPVQQFNYDGYLTTSPVKAFPPNPLGLYDIAGNVWEWCQDLYHQRYYEFSSQRNPQGPSESFDPQEPGLVMRSQRGGSFMCNVNNCTGYRCTARMRGEFLSSSFHNGFRCVVDQQGLTKFKQAQQKITDWRNSQSVQQPDLN
jgi:formylglycine-generating enzyme required for sulfatase activity